MLSPSRPQPMKPERLRAGQHPHSPQQRSRTEWVRLCGQSLTIGLLLCVAGVAMAGPIGAKTLQAAPVGKQIADLTTLGHHLPVAMVSLAGQMTVLSSQSQPDRHQPPSHVGLAVQQPLSGNQIFEAINPLAWLVVGLSVAIALALGALGVAKALRALGYVDARRHATPNRSGPSYYDQVTGLPGDRLFQILLKQAVLGADRSERVLALLLFKLDQLRVVSHQHGHASGDLALRVLAARVKSCLRPTDATARLGGDQFAVILDGVQSPEEGAALAQKILHTVVLPLTVHGHEILINTSIGIALYPIDSTESEGLMKSAAEAMSAASSQGLPIQFHAAHLNDQVFEGQTTDHATSVGENR